MDEDSGARADSSGFTHHLVDNATVGSAATTGAWWHHVALVFDAGTVRLYLNGALDRESTVAFCTLFDSTAGARWTPCPSAPAGRST